MFYVSLFTSLLRKAMYTVEKDYSVVGVLEMFNSSLDVLDAYLPGNKMEKSNSLIKGGRGVFHPP